MNPRPYLIALSIISAAFAFAQAPPAGSEPPPMSDEVREAIRKFKESRQAGETPVTDPAPPSSAETPVAEPTPASPSEPASPPEPTAEISSPPPAEPAPSLSVKVEKLQTGQGAIDPKAVTLRAPFPAKPLAPVPAGWHLEAPATAPPFLRTIDLAPGAAITLTIRPHLLVPDADSATTFSISEPGFDAALGYRQAHTIGAVLAASIKQLDEDSKQLGNAIDQLQQLVTALPQPAPAPEPITPPKSRPTRKP
jgi:hypothetical protein